MSHRLRCIRLVLAACALAGCRPASPPTRAWDPDSIPDAYARSAGALMWPGATRAFEVTPEGNLYNGAWALDMAPASDGVSAAPPRTVACEDRWCPVLRWTRHCGRVRWDFEAVALPEPTPGLFAARGFLSRGLAAQARMDDRRAEDAAIRSYPPEQIEQLLQRTRRPAERDPADLAGLLVSLRVRVHNGEERRVAARLDLAFRTGTEADPWLDGDSTRLVPIAAGWSARAANDPVLGWSAAGDEGPSRRLAWELAPGGDAVADLVLPVYPTPSRLLARWARVPHERRVEEARSYWRREVERGTRYELGDPEVETALLAARVVLLSLRERRGRDWVPIGGPFHYRDVWLRDGARAMTALALSGYVSEARSMARSFLMFQWPHGPFMSQTGQLDGSGQALWAFDQVLSRPAPDPDVGRFADAALRAVGAIERQRATTRDEAGGRFPGMLPITDPHDNEKIKAQIVGNDAWSIAGYRSALRLLTAAHRTRDADSVRAQLARYTSDFQAALARTAQPDIPPSWQGGGIDWGNLVVGYPAAVLPANDARLDRLAHRYFVPIGGAGIGYCCDARYFHTYVAVDLGTWALLAREPATADSTLAAELHWRTASGAASETFTQGALDFEANLPPHPTAAAALITLVRNQLVFDDGDTLQLTLGARNRWWRGARVTGAPTRWGDIDLAFHAKDGVAEWQWTPVSAWTELTLPPGFVRAGALPAGARPGADAATILVPPSAGRASVALAPAGGKP